MALGVAKTSFAAGELSPSLYGRIDFNKWHAGASVARNFFVNYKGGLMSRPGTGWAGPCKQQASASSNPPRNIPFKFNLFQSYTLEFGDQYMRVIANGAYVTESPIAITAATRANPCEITVPGIGALARPWAVGDYIYIVNVVGMTQLNGAFYILASVNLGAGTATLNDIFGDPVDSTPFDAYTSGGTAARLFTLTTPYAAADLPYLKFRQSADVMSLTCVNQQTQTDYAPQELTRVAADNWTIAAPMFASSIAAPTGTTATKSIAWSTGPGPAAYGYVVTAVAADGQESVASAIGACTSSVDIAGQFGTITVSWNVVAGAASYNVYRANPDYTNAGTFTGQLFGFVGSSRTNSWQDTNIIADFNTTPPLHLNPFPGSGDYPGVVSYFQQRRAYGGSLNAPDTYHLSRPGAYLNFDAADPPIDSDAITGTPWAQQVNGIQWMEPMPGGLIAATGESSWQVAGTGGAGAPITPAQQSAQPQDQIGFSATVPIIRINWALLYVPPAATQIRELQYNFYFNIYGSADRSLLSSHLLTGRTIKEWAWSLEPWKLAWIVTSDGKALSFAYLPEEEVRALTRHDTNGLFQSVSVASEPPVDAPYFIVKRYIRGKNKWMYYQERLNNRLWQNIEQCWCIDAGLSLPQPTPNATLTPAAAVGPGTPQLSFISSGGSGYTAPAGLIDDQGGPGTGAVVAGFTVVSGVITGVTITGGTNYTHPRLTITDATGSGAEIYLSVDNGVSFTADAAVFSSGDVGSVIRAGNGIATISSYVSTQEVIAQLPPATAITATIPNDPDKMPIPLASGDWTMTPPVSSVSGLAHLEGMQVNALADGMAINALTVENGQINLPKSASSIIVGLPFIAQAQTMHAELPGYDIQGKRKRVPGVVLRFANSRGVQVGQDQPIAAVQPNQAEISWNQVPNLMTPIDDFRNDIAAGAAIPLYSGDRYVPLAGDFNTTDGQPSPGMVAIQQLNPLPVELLSIVPTLELGDMPDA